MGEEAKSGIGYGGGVGISTRAQHCPWKPEVIECVDGQTMGATPS